jgi:superfamily II DNA/RNA helicase
VYHHDAEAGVIFPISKKKVVAEFGNDKFSVLVATNVAAQDLDINDVHLIIQV